MSPFAFLAPGVVVPQKKPSRPAVWVKSLNLPEMFTHKDVSVKVEDDVAHVTAARTFGDEEAGGTDTIQATRKVDIPADVNPDTVKSVWRKGRLFLRGDWRKQEKVGEEKEEDKSETSENQPDILRENSETNKPEHMTTEDKREKSDEGRKPLDLRLELPSISPENISVKLVNDRL